MLKSISILIALFASTAVDAQDALMFSGVSVGQGAVCATTVDNKANCSVGANRERVIPPEDLGLVSQIAVGENFACAVLLDGGTQCWGQNGFGETDAPGNAISFTDIDAGESHACGLNQSGNAICWGLDDNNRATPPDANAQYTDISVGSFHTCAIRTDGGVDCWGSESEFQLSVPTDLPQAVSIESDWRKTCILDINGDIHCWGHNASTIPSNGPYLDVAFANNMFCGLLPSGIPDCRLDALYGMTEDEAEAIEEAASEAGPFSSIDISGAYNGYTGCGVTLIGELECWVGGDALISGHLANESGFVPTIEVSIYSDSTAEILWGRPETGEQDLLIAGYEVHRNGEAVAMVSNVNSYLDTTLIPGTSYTYQVRSISNGGVADDFSNAITIDTGDRNGGGGTDGGYEPPSRPVQTQGLNALIYSPSSLELVWDRPSVAVQGYEIRLNGEYVRFTNGTSAFFDNLATDTNHQFDVIAIAENGSMGGYDSITVALGDALECR